MKCVLIFVSLLDICILRVYFWQMFSASHFNYITFRTHFVLTQSPCYEQTATQRHFFRWSTAGLNSILKSPVCPSIDVEKNSWIHSFPKGISTMWNTNSLVQDLDSCHQCTVFFSLYYCISRLISNIYTVYWTVTNLIILGEIFLVNL